MKSYNIFDKPVIQSMYYLTSTGL